MNQTTFANNDPLAGLAGYPGPERVGRLSAAEGDRLRSLARLLPPALIGVIGAWVAFLLATSWLSAGVSPLFLLLAPTFGLYFFAWLGYYRHELWHNYFPVLNNRAWFYFVSCLLLSDSQVFRVAHSSHHKYVHTPDDLEFFCEDWQTSPSRRRRQFIAELVLGNLAWELATFRRLRKQGITSYRFAAISLVVRLVIATAIVTLAGQLAPQGGLYCIAVFALTGWSGAVLTRHSQWVEHLGIVSNGDIIERNLLARNISRRDILSRIFNFITHADAKEHVYHHTDGRLPTRNTNLTLPPEAREITFRQYLALLASHYRSLN